MAEVPNRCETTGKVVIATKNLARKRLRKLSGSPHLRVVEAYQCRFCGFWHLTSTRNRVYQEAKRNG